MRLKKLAVTVSQRVSRSPAINSETVSGDMAAPMRTKDERPKTTSGRRESFVLRPPFSVYRPYFTSCQLVGGGLGTLAPGRLAA